MHRDALVHLDLYCISCRTFDGQVTQYQLRLVPEQISGDYVITGYLECSHCGQRYPISEGVPHLVEGIPRAIEYATQDFRGSPRYQELTAQYLDAHYSTINAGYWRQMTNAIASGLCLDVGCSVGRYTFQCAEQGFAVGIDVNADQLRLAAAFQREGKISYTRQTRALHREVVASDFVPSEAVLFLLADVHDPPFRMETFDFIAALNVIDSVKRPLTALGQMDALLKQGGRLFLSTPYVWNSEISDEWLETEEIDSHSFVKQLLTGKQLPQCEFKYRISTEESNIPWCLRRQDTQRFVYSVDAIVAEKL